MTEAQRARMMLRFDNKRRAAPEGGPARALAKIILYMLGYGAGVRDVAKRSAKFHARYGRTV